MRIVTQAPTVFTVRFYPQLHWLGGVAIAIALYLGYRVHQSWQEMTIGNMAPSLDSVIGLSLAAALGGGLFLLGLAQVLPRLLFSTLTIDQEAGLVCLQRGVGKCDRTTQLPLADVTGMHLVNRWGLSPRLVLWTRRGDRVQGTALSIPAHFNLKELENIKATVTYILVATGQPWLTTNFSQCHYQTSWYVTQTPTRLVIHTDHPEYRIRFVVDRTQGNLTVSLYRHFPQEYWLRDIHLIQLEDDYSPSGQAIPWIRLQMTNGDRPVISQEWGQMGGYREIAKHLARFMKVDLQVL